MKSTRARVLGTVETLIGAGIITYAVFNPESRQASKLYVGGSTLIIDGLTDIITGEYAYLFKKAKYLIERRRK